MTGTAPGVLVRVPNWLGDVVMALPAIRAVQRHFGPDRVWLCGPASMTPILEMVAGADHTVALRGGRGLRVLWRMADDVEAIRAGGFSTAILLTNSFQSALAVRRAGVPERWGYARDARGLLLTKAIRARAVRKRGAATRHHSAYYRSLVEALGIGPVGDDASIQVPHAWKTNGREFVERHGIDMARPLVGIAPGAAYGHAKRWPPERVAELVQILVAHGLGVVLVGAPGDRDSGRAVESAVARAAGRLPEGAFANVVGATDLGTMMGIASIARAFVSNDSGAMHLASAAGVPVVAIFGPTDEIATHPLGRHTIVRHDVFCRPCLLRECPIDHRCMRGIEAPRVAALVIDALAGAGGGSA